MKESASVIRIRDEDLLALRNSSRFDADWYCVAYPDVAASGLDPAEHFLWVGERLGRLAAPPPLVEPQITRGAVDGPTTNWLSDDGEILDALFIDGTNGTSSTPYRVFRIANGLRTQGWKVRCVRGDEIAEMMRNEIFARFVVFHRAPFWSPYADLFKRMRAVGAIIIFDIDDLVFDETIIPYIDGFRSLPSVHAQAFLDGVRAYREFIMQADLCTVATTYLVDHVRKMGKPAYRVRNAISSENIKFVESIAYRRRGRPNPFVVGYYSGTKTHQADFAVAAPALIQFMQDQYDVVFRLVGELDLDDYPQLANWQNIHRPGDIPRVTRVGLMPHDAMLRDQFSCDLIIAPLEIGNPFCEAKSELKFFEASLVQCPVIVSATQTFSEATEDGRLGRLATTTAEWLGCFQDVYDNYPAALNRAVHAFDHVRYAYSQRFATDEALEVYEHFEAAKLGVTRLGDTENGGGTLADIGIILPDFSGPSGGHRKVFMLCHELERIGLRVKIYIYTIRKIKDIKRDIAHFFADLNAEIAGFSGEMEQHSYVICTHWTTAYDFRNIYFEGRLIYFVQDFEPMFFAAGAYYLRALASYQANAQIVCYGEWVAAKLADEIGLKPSVIPFTLDHRTYFPLPGEGRRDIDVLAFARPSQDRRCFDLIIEGVVSLKKRRPALRIALFGEQEYEDYGVELENFGQITDLDELASLYHRAKVGICYSPTNPSQLGYEMVACGVALVDVRIKFSELNFDGDSFVLYTNGTPEDMGLACEELLSDPVKRRTRQQRGYNFVSSMMSDEQFGPAFLKAVGISGTRKLRLEDG